MSKGNEVLMELPVRDVIPTLESPRNQVVKDEKYKKLLESVKRNGVKVRVIARPHPTKTGKWDMRAGARRLAAVKDAGLKEIPATVHLDLDDKAAFDITFLENFGRKDLTPLEDCRAVEILMEKRGNDITAVAADLGWSEKKVRLRMKLKDLSKEWKKELVAGKPGTAFLSAAHLGLIARLSHYEQDFLLGDPYNEFCEWKGNDPHLISVADLDKRLSEGQQLIKGITWEADDATLVPKAGACSSCPNRTDSEKQRGLWDEDGDVVESSDHRSRCLDSVCWDDKRLAQLARQHASLAKDHKGLIAVVAKGLCDDDREILEKKLGKIADARKGNYRATHSLVKKSTKGAVPAMLVDGAKAGQIAYVVEGAAPEGQGVSAFAGTKGAPGKPTPLKERRKVLESKRWAQTIKELGERVDNHPRGEYLPEGDIIKLVAAFGTMDNNIDAGKGPWKAFESQRCFEAVDQIWGEVRKVLSVRISLLGWGVTQTPDAIIEEAKRVARLLNINVKAIYETVCVQKGFTVPKAWANLKKDGTPKTAPKKEGKVKTKEEPKKGVCQVCGCTESTPCSTAEGPCAWTDSKRNLCTGCAERQAI